MQRPYVIAMSPKLELRPLRLGPADDYIFALKAKHDAYVFQDAASDCDFHSWLNVCFSVASFHGRIFFVRTQPLTAINAV